MPNSFSDGVFASFKGSGEGMGFPAACRKGAWRASIAGVAGLLWTRKCRKPLPCGEPERGEGDG